MIDTKELIKYYLSMGYDSYTSDIRFFHESWERAVRSRGYISINGILIPIILVEHDRE